MTPTAFALSEGVYQRLHQLSVQAGQPPEAVLDQALADYERKLLSGEQQAARPHVSPEAELFDDVGRICIPTRAAQAVTAQVQSAGRQPPRLRGEEE